MKENLQFLQAFLKNPLKVGALTPSSDELAAEMLDGITPDPDNIVLELGFGPGPHTKPFKQLFPTQNSSLGFELNHIPPRSPTRRYPDMNIVCGDAAESYKIHVES